ncbi:hypothetical protein ACUNHX_17340 [Serratia sp. IR-2025]|nr:hypothetical protein [Serratia marcescens]MBN5347018.1 hypothetical protein [Serratia marcescens]
MNKPSELSKPVAWKFKNADGGDRVSLERKANIYGRHDFQPLYSQEYVSALLAHIAELERILDGVTPVMIAGGWTAKGISDYAKSLEAKLATPVRLPDIRFIKVDGTAVAVMRADRVKEQIHHAGFKVEGVE